MGGMGMGGRGQGVLNEFMSNAQVQVVAVCDAWKNRRDGWAARAKCQAYADFRDLLARLKDGQQLVDLVRITDGESIEGKYIGICW